MTLDVIEYVEQAAGRGSPAGAALGIQRQGLDLLVDHGMAQFTFQQRLYQQGEEVDAQESVDAADFLEVDRRDFEVCFELREAFFNQGLPLVGSQQLFGRQISIVADQRKDSIAGLILGHLLVVDLYRKVESRRGLFGVFGFFTRPSRRSLLVGGLLGFFDLDLDPRAAPRGRQHFLDGLLDLRTQAEPRFSATADVHAAVLTLSGSARWCVFARPHRGGLCVCCGTTAGGNLPR